MTIIVSGIVSMKRKRTYKTFIHKEAVFSICCDRFEAVTGQIVLQRKILEDYIVGHPEFQHSFEPLELQPVAPEIARRMAAAAELTGLGPMAAVAGAMAQFAVEAGLAAGAGEALIENGGDIYLRTSEPVVVGLYSGENEKLNRLAFELQPEETPVSICSSSGIMGHSVSLGHCDLATVVAPAAALADAAATLAANCVKNKGDVESALDRITYIQGVSGVLIISEGQIGLAGNLPKLIRQC